MSAKSNAAEYHSVADWCAIFTAETGMSFNLGTVRKRRAMSGIGILAPPRTYLLTRREFERVLATPLPMCNQVVGSGQ